MEQPKPIPLNPETPKTKQVKKYRLSSLYPEGMKDDVYIRPDSDSVYAPITPNLDKSDLENANENTENGN